ncbi:MAG: L-2-hydroxyglutarate oxidase [Chloroflexi bacterium]|nr:L-2-hydroxyglutarate oxidase [Chloroflexota bacterium]
MGGGIVGLATAYRLLEARPHLRLAVLEKEPELARHQSGHNSGVVHAGLYYAPGSLKARLCREGKQALEAFCAERNIPLERTGKLVVALDETELPRLAALRERALANRVEGLEEVGRERIRELEPHAAGIRALWSPTTGIVDFRRVCLAYADEVGARGGEIHCDRAVTGVERRPAELVLTTTRGDLLAGSLIACAGLQADRVARLTGDVGPERIVPFRGDYYTLRQEASSLVRGLIYPVPDPRFPFLGVHLTKRIDGQVWAGPNAVLAFAREGYRRRDLDPLELVGVLTDRAFLRLALRFWRTGLAETWRDWSKGAFLRQLRRYLPELRGEQLIPGPSGVRAQALDPDGTLVDDFRLGQGERVLHVRNAPSPAATSSLAIGRELAQRAITQFGLG